MRILLALLVCAAGPIAHAEMVRVPDDPPALRSAQEWLAFDWQSCRADLYPQDPEAGTEKWSTVVRFSRAGGRSRGDLTMSVHRNDGARVAPSKLQLRFIACVERRFEARRFPPLDRNMGANWSISSPFGMYPVLNGTELARSAAQLYVSAQLSRAKLACGARASGVAVTVDVAANGSVAAVSVTGASAKAASCIEKRLAAKLRFPTISAGATVGATD